MKMKKKILFVINNLEIGGAEKCLVSLLHELNSEKYSIDIFLFRHQGPLLHKLPQNINLLPEPSKYVFFDSSLFNTLKINLKKASFKIVFDRIGTVFVNASNKNSAVKEQLNWRFLKKHLDVLPQKYEAAFGFLEKTPNYFVMDKVIAKKKILSVMTDYSALGMDQNIDRPYFSKANYITALSEENLESLKSIFPEFKNKIILIENMISKKEILSLAEKEITDFPENNFTIVSVGRLVEAKIHEVGVEVMRILKSKNLKFNWLILGEGNRRPFIEDKIKKYNLEKYITLLGENDNPYPYIKKADIFLHLSKFEGYGIAIAEARILKKCIVLNDFTTSASHITNGVDGVIAPLNPEVIASEIEKLIVDENLRRKYEKKVSFDPDFAQRILRKIDQIIES